MVIKNLFNPVAILANCGSQSFYLVSALLAQFANYNYNDWFSFSYWMGDLFYRVLVVQTTFT